MSEPAQDVQPKPGLLDRGRLTLILLLLLAEVGIFLAGLLLPVPASTRQALANQTSSQFGVVENGTAVQLAGFIFTHNLTIALAEMIPIAGALLFAFSVFSTGLAAQALVTAQGLPASWGAAILVFPYSLVELGAYAVAVGSGILLLRAWRRGRLRAELEVFALEGLSVVLILFVAAAMETVTVRVSALVGLALWLPTALALGGLMVVVIRRQT